MAGFPVTRRASIGLLAAAAFAPVPLAAQKNPRRIVPGRDPDYEGPRKADFHVTATGDDQNPGSLTAPFRTVQRAVDELSRRASGSIAIHAGTYREQVSLDALRGRPNPEGAAAYRIHAYGQDRAVISAAEVLQGWSKCAAAELQALGLPQAAIYKTRVPLSALQHEDPFALNLHEDGQWCPIATRTGSAAPPDHEADPDHMLEARFLTGSGGVITGLQDRRLIGRDREAMLETRILLYHVPNVVKVVIPDSFDTGTGTFRFAAQKGRLVQKRNGKPCTVYSLLNDPGAMTPGAWHIRRGRQSIELYFLPRTPVAPQDRVEASLRGVCVDLGGARGVELSGLDLMRASGRRPLVWRLFAPQWKLDGGRRFG